MYNNINTFWIYKESTPVDTYKVKRRGGKGISGLTTREDDFVKQIFNASTHDIILFSQTKVSYTNYVVDIPEAGRTAKELQL